MRILILGGSHLIGRHIAETLHRDGNSVSVFNRGVSPDGLPSGIERLRGDRDEGSRGLDALEGRSWDACVDVSGYTAIQVRASAEKLRSRAARYIYISAVKAYGNPETHPVYETHPLMHPADEDVTELDDDTYGALKVRCERIVMESYPDRFTILRPQVATGPYDQSGRYAYWLKRAMAGTRMLAPGDGSDHLQVIDARDIAGFVKTILENAGGGIFNVAGPRFTWAEFMRMIGAKDIVWVPAEIIRAEGLTFSQLPLYRPENDPRGPLGSPALMDVNCDLARKAGLALTAPQDTVRAMREWMADREFPAMLPAETEAALIRLVSL